MLNREYELEKQKKHLSKPRFDEESHPICTHFSGRPTPVLIIIVMATHYLCKRGSKQGFQNDFGREILLSVSPDLNQWKLVPSREGETWPPLKRLHA